MAYKLLSCEAESQKIKHTRGAKKSRSTHALSPSLTSSRRLSSECPEIYRRPHGIIVRSVKLCEISQNSKVHTTFWSLTHCLFPFLNGRGLTSSPISEMATEGFIIGIFLPHLITLTMQREAKVMFESFYQETDEYIKLLLVFNHHYKPWLQHSKCWDLPAFPWSFSNQLPFFVRARSQNISLIKSTEKWNFSKNERCSNVPPSLK